MMVVIFDLLFELGLVIVVQLLGYSGVGVEFICVDLICGEYCVGVWVGFFGVDLEGGKEDLERKVCIQCVGDFGQL